MLGPWEMWANECGGEFRHVGTRWYVELYEMDEPVVPVLVEVCVDGPYWGWIERDEREPALIQPSEMLFNMQFPYGYKRELERGPDGGQLVRLRITPR